jgi:hypothetical protein
MICPECTLHMMKVGQLVETVNDGTDQAITHRITQQYSCSCGVTVDRVTKYTKTGKHFTVHS